MHRILANLLNVFDNAEEIYERYINDQRPRILEISFGFGINTYTLLKRVSLLNGLLVSIDIDSTLLRIGEKIFRKYIRSELLRLEKADATSLPYGDDYFDYVVSHMTLHHIGNVSKSVREMMRVLRVGGKLIIIDLVPNTFYSVIPGHDRDILKRSRDEALREVSENMEIIHSEENKYVYTIVALKR
jgi:ubiquinone/menaquinone biosynthesis C-methylase UbiE